MLGRSGGGDLSLASRELLPCRGQFALEAHDVLSALDRARLVRRERRDLLARRAELRNDPFASGPLLGELGDEPLARTPLLA